MNVHPWPSYVRPSPLAILPNLSAFSRHYSHEDHLAVRPTDTGWEFSAELPGISVEDLKIEALTDRITVTLKNQEAQAEGWKLVHQERVLPSFSESFHFRAPIAVEGVEATVREGVLTIVVPRAALPSPRLIPVTH